MNKKECTLCKQPFNIKEITPYWINSEEVGLCKDCLNECEK